MIFRFALCMGLAVFLTGCAHYSGGVAPSTVPLEPGQYRILGDVRGEDCVYYLLGVIPLTGGNETKTAIANALEEAPGSNALIGVSSDTFSQYFIVVARTCTQVHGTAVIAR